VGSDFIADLKTLDGFSNCVNDPSAFVPKDARQGNVEGIVRDVVQVGGANRRGDGLDQEFVVPGLRHGSLDLDQVAWGA
jgi:hypothetical protein